MSPQLDLRDSLKLYLFTNAILLLSLDRVTAFWADLGLRLPPGEVKEAARRCIRAKIALDNVPGDDLDYNDKVTVHAAQFLADADRAEGPAGKGQIQAWIEDSFLPLSREPEWKGVWNLLLWRLEPEEENLGTLPGLPPDKREALFQLVRAWVEANVTFSCRVEAAEELPLEGWDAEAYDDYRRETPLVSPLDPLHGYLRALAFTRTWSEILRQLDPAELDALEHWGQAEIQSHFRTIEPQAARIPPEGRRLS